AEDVIPAPAVEPGGMVAQLPQDLVGLERGEDRLDQHRGADGPSGNTKGILSVQEDVVPEARFEVALELWEIEVRPGAARDERRRGVEERQSKIEQRGRDRAPVHLQMLFDQVPAAGPDDERGGPGVERVALSLGAR